MPSPSRPPGGQAGEFVSESRTRHTKVMRDPMTCQVAIAAVDGCMVSAVAGIEDALNIATFLAAGSAAFAPLVVSVDGAPAQGFGGRRLDVAGDLDRAAAADVLVVPPVLGDVTQALAQGAALVAFLRRRRPQALVASACTGAFFLGEAGLLDGKRATTNPAMGELLAARYPRVHVDCRQRLIDEHDVISAGTTTAFLDLAIHLVARFADHEVAVLTAKALSMDLNRGSQLPYVTRQHRRAHGDADVLALQDWLASNYQRALSLATLAKRAAMSTRTLNRRFRAATGVAPMAFLHELRIEAAKRLLDSDTAHLADITVAVGYQDARSFSRLFRRLTGLSPRDYRRRFGRG